MTQTDLQNIIKSGESDTVEFKQSFNKTVIETLVAFSNSNGGRVLIGVDNTGAIKGVSITEESVQKWINEIKQNTEPQIIPDTETISIEEKKLLFYPLSNIP